MRYIFYTDPHHCSSPGGSRLDDRTETAVLKLRWVLALAAQNGVDTVICGGDMFESPAQKMMYVSRVIDALIAYRERGVRVYTVAGNHDTSLGVFDNYTSGALGVLVSTGVVSLLGDLPIGGGCVMRGVSAYRPLDLSDADRVSYLVVHASVDEAIGDAPGVVDGVPVAGGTYYRSEDLKALYPNLRAVLWGHLHHETVPHKAPCGVWLVNPGSLMRVSSARENLRVPKVVYGDTDVDGFQMCPVAVALPFESVFNLDSKAVRKGSEAELSRFIDMVSGGRAVSVDMRSVIAEMLSQVPDQDRLLIETDLKEHGMYS